MKKINLYITRLSFMLVACVTMALVACNDNIADEDLYTYKPEMLSDYLRKNADFSDFAAIVEKAGKMELLSTYGTYTCFAPTNDAVQKYLKDKGINGIDGLSTADCDTIASTLLVDKLYSMADLSDLQGFIEDQNMLGRPLACEPVKVLIGEDSVTTSASTVRHWSSTSWPTTPLTTVLFTLSVVLPSRPTRRSPPL